MKGVFLTTPSMHRLMESDIRYNFQDGRYDVISRRKVLPSRECRSKVADFVACFIPKISGTIFRPVHGRLAEWQIWNVSVHYAYRAAARSVARLGRQKQLVWR